MKVNELKDKILSGYLVKFSDCEFLLKETKVHELSEIANEIRAHFTGNYFDLCSITNAKSGQCTEDCKWCAQSKSYSSGVETYEMIDAKIAVKQAVENSQQGVHKYSLVTSGKQISDKNLTQLISIYKQIAKKSDIHLCASMGLLSESQLVRLKDAGIAHYHCNLETSRSFFSNLCSTHSYDDKIETIKTAQKIGLDVCSGGIIGMGETMEQRMELAFELREIGVKSIPINVLMPIDGTPLAATTKLSDDEILRTLAIFRIINPDALIRFAGGRVQMKHIENQALKSGVNAALVGNLLTTVGSDIKQDLKTFGDAGFNLINS